MPIPHDLNLILGIDVSHWDDSAIGPMQWHQVVGAGVRWAYAKATEGLSSDPSFINHRLGASVMRIPFGAYIFVRPDVDGDEQAEHFINIVGPRRDGELPPALDLEPSLDQNGLDRWESLSVAERQALVAMIYSKLKAFYGCIPVRYHDRSFWNEVIGNPDGYTGPEWIAAYDGTNPNAMIWQYTESGQIDGIQGKADLDVCRPEFLELIKQ